MIFLVRVNELITTVEFEFDKYRGHSIETGLLAVKIWEANLKAVGSDFSTRTQLDLMGPKCAET